MCRGKAVKDFKGPDCRFVDFKEGESVYVYYKLSGRTNDLWAGSVGSNFGYFPKDLLEINHIYTHDELEVPTDETDFICFEDGKDDFENYNADELIKLSEDIVDNDMEHDLETEKEEGIEKTDPTESIDPESDDLEVDVEDSNEDHAEMSEENNFIFEKNKNVAGSLDSKRVNHALNSNMDNPQGEQSAQQPSEDMLQEMLKVPEHESAKNVTLSQGESKQSDYGSRNDSAYKPLHQELSEDLKTTFGSTADAVVSDDETTSLVTSLDGDAGQDLDIDSYDVENPEEALKESDKIPLLSFTEEDIKSSDDPESENMSSDDIFESKTSDPDYDTREATTKLINEKKDDSDLLTNIGNKIFAIVSGGERRTDENTDDLEEEEEEEEEDNHELAVISKEKDEDVLAHLVTSSEDVPLISEHELIAKKVHNVDISDPKEEKTQEKGNSKSGVEATIEKPQSKSMTIGAFSNYGDGLQSKASIETKEESVKPPLGDIKDDPEGLSFHKIIKDREGMKHLEDNLENDTKHKIVWDKLSQTEDEKEKSVNIVSELLEEQINQSQSDVDDENVLEGKTEYDTKQDDKDFELKMVLSEKQVNVSAMENVAVEEHSKEALKESKQEKEDKHLEEEDGNDENDLTSSKEILEKRSAVENTMRATQHGNFPQQNIVPKQAEQSSTDGDIDGEELPKTEPQFLELDAEGDNILEEEELLQDENALSAKMSKEGLAAEQSFTSGIESASPQLQMPNDAILRAANPADSGKEAITTLEQAKVEDSRQDLNKENEGIQINEDSQLNEMKKRKDKEKLSMVDEKHKKLDLYDKMTSNGLNLFELEDKKDDLNETERHLQEKNLQKEFKDKQVTAEDSPLHSHHPSGPIGDSEHTNEATEPEYSQSVRQLTIMHEYLDVKRIERLQKYLGEQHTFRIESLFQDMEQELMVAQKHDNPEETEKALDEILETSESNVLDIVNNVLDSREIENKEEVIREMDLFDEEAAIMEDIQELMYSLRQKYSPISESAPLVSLPQSEMDSGAPITANAKQTEHEIHVVENTEESTDQKLPGDTEQMSKEDAVLQFDPAEKADHLDQPEDGNILTETVTLDEMEDTKVLDGDKSLPRVDIVLGSDDLGRTIEKDMTPDLNGAKNDTVEDSGDPSEADSDASHSIASWDASIFSVKAIMQHFTENIVSNLPEEIRPGPDFHGLPWEPIMITVLIGFATLFYMFCRICLPIKKRIYQVSEKQMCEKINMLRKDQANILKKLSENEQKAKDAKDSFSVMQKSHRDISDSKSVLEETSENIFQKKCVLNDRMERVKNTIQMENEKRNKNKNQFTEIQKSMDTFQETLTLLLKKQFELQRTLRESKLNEENMKSELCNVLEKNAVLQKNKEELLQEMKGWCERDAEQRAQLNFYQKYLRDLEEIFIYKENESEAMTKCIVDLKDLDTVFETGKNRDEGNDLASGQSSEIKKEKMNDQIVKMMEISKVQATFSTCEQEIIYLQAKLKEEVTARHALEEKMKNVELESSSLRTSKIQADNELKTLHQKLEVLNEHFQKKEMLLEKQLAEEEYELQEKQQKLSAAATKADLASKEVKLYKQKIAEMEEEFKKKERRYKEEIAANEKKAHDNWLSSRALERKLAAEQKDASNLRHQLINVNKQLEMFQSPLFKNLNSYRPDRHGLPHEGPLSQDGSFGPSPVSGEAPSPPLMTGFPGQPLPANLKEGLRVGDGSPPPNPRHFPPHPSASYPRDYPPGPWPPYSRDYTPRLRPPFPRDYPPAPWPVFPNDYPPCFPPPFPMDYPPGPPFGMQDVPPRPLPPPEQRGYLRGAPLPFWPPPPRDYDPCFSLAQQGVSAYPPPPVKDLPHAGTNTIKVDCVPNAALQQQCVRDCPPAPPAKDLPPAGPDNKRDCVPRPSIPLQGVSAYPPPVEDLSHAGTKNKQVYCVPHAVLPPQGARVYPTPPLAKDIPGPVPNVNQGSPPLSSSSPDGPVNTPEMV